MRDFFLLLFQTGGTQKEDSFKKKKIDDKFLWQNTKRNVRKNNSLKENMARLTNKIKRILYVKRDFCKQWNFKDK